MRRILVSFCGQSEEALSSTPGIEMKPHSYNGSVFFEEIKILTIHPDCVSPDRLILLLSFFAWYVL